MTKNDAHNVEKLEHYIAQGVTRQKSQYDPVVEPQWKPWESFLPSELKMHGVYRELEMEGIGALPSAWPTDLAGACFASIYTSELVEFRAHALFPRRFPGRVLQMMSMKSIPYTALGFLTGAYAQARQLARVQIFAYRSDFYFMKAHYPIFTFILRLLADFLGEPPLAIEGESAHEPICNLLFDTWRSPSPQSVQEVLLAACDFHTGRCIPPRRDEYHEFDNGSWMRIPIEILLVIKLRSLIGLQNPHLEHPMMDSAFGILPPEIGFQPDVLTARVRARMSQDGYDEEEIVRLAAVGA